MLAKWKWRLGMNKQTRIVERGNWI